MQNDDGRRLSLFYLTTLALALGLVTGLGAFLFRDLIGLLHNIFFTGRFMVPNRDFTIVGEDVVAYDVIDKMWRKHAFMAVVVRGHGMRGAEDVLGVITKEHVADSVASSLKIYPR